jgi:hypothetical protein
MTQTTPVTLVTGGTARAREAALAVALTANIASAGFDIEYRPAVILEGMPDGADTLAEVVKRFPFITIVRIAPGCPCCNGNLTMRVTLNRILRHRPDALYIGLATATHLDQVRAFLTQDPYDKLLHSAKDIAV